MSPLVGSGVWFGSGNGGKGVFSLGNLTTTTNIYTYSSNGVATGTNLTATPNAGAATSTYPGGF